MPSKIYFHWRILLSHIHTTSLAVPHLDKIQGQTWASPTQDNPNSDFVYTVCLSCPSYYISYSKHGYNLVFISRQAWLHKSNMPSFPSWVAERSGLTSGPMPSFPSWVAERSGLTSRPMPSFPSQVGESWVASLPGPCPAFHHEWGKVEWPYFRTHAQLSIMSGGEDFWNRATTLM